MCSTQSKKLIFVYNAVSAETTVQDRSKINIQTRIHAIAHIIKKSLDISTFCLPECWPGVNIQPEVPGVYHIDIFFVRLCSLILHSVQR
jgi:hypothetical protein